MKFGLLLRSMCRASLSAAIPLDAPWWRGYPARGRVIVRWWNGRAWIERHGFHHTSCITRPCSAIVSHDLAEIDPVLTAVLLAALIVALACRRQTKRRPWMHLLLAHVVITTLLLLLPPRPPLVLQPRDSGVDDGMRAHECLYHSSPQLPPLRYPRDAEAHFAAVHTALRPWLVPPRGLCGAGYCGEKVEDMWVHRFAPLAGQQWPRAVGEGQPARATLANVTVPSTPLRRHFGSFIPLFIPWNRWHIAAFRLARRYPPGLIETLRANLRSDALYVTVVQDDQGLIGPTRAGGGLDNVLVLSAGGYGHVPLPLLNQPETLLTNPTPPAQRRLFVSYVGSRTNAPHSMRAWTIRVTRACCAFLGRECAYFHGAGWRDVMAQSRFSLCPRGFGRSSYHVAETPQLGLVPIHVYSDRPWLPYERTFESCGFATSVFGLHRSVTPSCWRGRRVRSSLPPRTLGWRASERSCRRGCSTSRATCSARTCRQRCAMRRRTRPLSRSAPPACYLRCTLARSAAQAGDALRLTA